MGQSHSSSTHSKRKSFLITPKKLVRLRRQTCENSGAQQDDSTQTQEGEIFKTADKHARANRHKETTHTYENVETVPKQHDEVVETFSHDLTAAREESLNFIEENLLQQLRELIENLLCSGDRIDGDIVIEIDSNEKTLKILPQQQSSLIRVEDQEEIPQSLASSLSHQGLIIIREHTTPSSGDTFFTDAASSQHDHQQQQSFENLSVRKLEQFDIASDIINLKIIRNESINVDSRCVIKEKEEGGVEIEMPIVKNSFSSNGNGGQHHHHHLDGSDKDKGMFNVSRVKKVELSEIPLATDICTTSTLISSSTNATSTNTTIVEQQSIQKPSSSSNGSKVLDRVISLTTANHNNDNNNFTKPAKPSFIPEKLQFCAYEKFEGQMLLNWFLQSIPSSLSSTLNENDLNALTMQYCTNLLIAGIIKPLDTTSCNNNNNEVFKSNFMYQWTYKEPTVISNLPGKLETGVVWPYSNNNNSSSNERKPNTLSSSPTKRDGESKIPKLVSNFTSTPKPSRFQSSSVASLFTPENSILLNGNELDQNSRIAELKNKLSKCDTMQETLMLIRSFLSEYAMQSSESSTNSGVFTNSVINGSDTTIFEKTFENFQSKIDSPAVVTNSNNKSVMRTPPKTVRSSLKSRTSPTTPTSRSNIDSRRLRKNNSADSVSLPASNNNNSNSTLCKKCMLISSPTKITKRFVDKATVMDVEPIVFQKSPEMKDAEIQTDLIAKEENDDDEKEQKENKIDEKEQEKTEIELSAAPVPPPPLPASSIPPPPPPMMMMMNAPKPPGPPPPPPPFNSSNNGIPMPPPPINSLKGPNPLPPPINLNAGPGNKSNLQTSSNSSNLIVTGKSRPAPLPLPAFEFYQTNTLRKNAVNPPKPMKPLYWTRIVTPIIPQDSVDGGCSSLEEINEEKDELWKEIDETKLDNLDEFTELFSRQCVVPKAKESTPLPKIKTIKVLDSKRSQNVGIFVRSIHVDFAEIEHAIYEFDTSVISLETLQNIMAIRATNDELTMIKESIEAHNSNSENSIPLDTPERFLLKLSQISSSSERISCIVFQDEFEEQCVMVSRKVAIVKSLCEFLLENEGLKEVFSIILTLGNFMNGGNRTRGQADGFGLEILGKLKDVKSKDPKITLLHFIVKTYITRSRQSGVAITDLVLPVPDANDVDKSLSIDFEECKQQLNALKNKVEECKKTMEKVIAVSSEEHVQPFKDKMESFLTMASQRIESRFDKVEECKLVFIKTVKFYKYMPKGGAIEETTPAQFFEYWTSFTSDFNGIFKKEIVILTNELFKKSRQVSKPQSKPLHGENNLKARINRLKSRDK